ncbi:MAG: (2Fe-2S)-binding protein [Bauldia sp.]|nr:(2Fe-2S)-binding protein [Bauldia sp.]
MIVCSCNVLSHKQIEAAAERLVEGAPDRPVTAGRAFRALGTKPQCGGCLELIRHLVREMGIPVTCPEPLGSVAEGTAADLPELPVLHREAV